MLLILILILIPTLTTSQPSNSSCLLDFSVLRRLAANSTPRSLNASDQCNFILRGLRLVLSEYLRRTNSFLPPPNSAESCWNSYQSLVNNYLSNFDIRSNCGFQTIWISKGCRNITTKSQYESLNSPSTLNGVVSACNQSLLNSSPCSTCIPSLATLQPPDLPGPDSGNVSDCVSYRSIYAAAFANYLGPTDRGTADCLFSLKFDYSKSSSHTRNTVVIVIVCVLVVVIPLMIGFGWFWRRRRLLKAKLKRKEEITRRWSSMNPNSALESISGSTTLIRFTLDEIQESTHNFARSNIIGRGGYGNVYKGLLVDGTEVALKRFKNCSATGDASFAHEVEVIASVRHVNLVALRGYCTATTNFEGHQRIIVCDLMKNGSVHDHLFGEENDGKRKKDKLSWPLRQKIALGTARGLAYLHYGVTPAIIHRDIKGSNILLDETFEPKVADFGLAKFAPEGATHVSTRVAGTMGYVAPEYALYGQLTERSDVYSFGVVLLEILSGKKALLEHDDEQQPTLVADWAWSLVRKGKAKDVVEQGMPELGPPQVMEKYVLLAVLCSHPQLYARPTMDQVVKIMETDLPVPVIPERPIPLTADLDDIEKSISTNNSGQLSNYSSYQPYSVDIESSRAA